VTAQELIDVLIGVVADLPASLQTEVEFAVCNGKSRLDFVNDVDIEPSSFVPKTSEPEMFVLLRVHLHDDTTHRFSGQSVAANVDDELRQLTEDPDD
jgi:hypothetical protein